MGTEQGSGYYPARPSLSAIFICSIAFWAFCATSYATGDVRDAHDCGLWALIGVACAVASGAVVAVHRTRMIGLVAMSAAIGFTLGGAQAAQMHETAAALDGVSEPAVELTLLEDSSDKGFGETALVEADIVGRGQMVFSGRFDTSTPLLCGQHVVGNVTCTELDYTRDSYSWREGSCGRLVITGSEEAEAPEPIGGLVALRAQVIDLIGASDAEHALLQALVCGYRRNIADTELYASFQTCGLAHLVAVSGAHLVIVTGLFAAILKRLNASRRLSSVLLVVGMFSYFVIAGMPVSALRATVMSTLGLASFFGKRRASSMNALGISIFAMIALSPSTSVSVSFALSALSTMGIILFAPLFNAWFERTPIARAGFVVDALSLTAGASTLSQLYACSIFNQLPLISPLANIVSAPLFPIVCGAGLLAGMVAVALPGAASISTIIPASASALLSNVVGLIAQIPFASIPFAIDSLLALVLSGGFALLLWATWPRDVRRCALVSCVAMLAAVVALAVTTDGADSIVMLDVGQGDAILIRSQGRSLLIDTGNQDSKLLGQLARNRVIQLDSVLISHADDDQCGCK